MRLCTGLTRAEFALLPWPRTTSRAPDSLYLLESRLFDLHGRLFCSNPKKRDVQLCTVIGWLLKHPHFTLTL
jgi:hypothetical protein